LFTKYLLAGGLYYAAGDSMDLPEDVITTTYLSSVGGDALRN